MGGAASPARKRGDGARLRAGEDRFRAILAGNADGIMIVDAAGRVLFANQSACHLFDRSEEELRRDGVGIPVLESASCEVQIRQPGGSSRITEMSAVPVEWDSAPCLLVSLRDVTLRKELEEQLRSARELEDRRVGERKLALEAANRELEALSSCMAHDLRAPLRSIDGWSLAVLEECGAALSPRGRQDLERVRMAAQHMGRVLEDILELSRVMRALMHVERVDLSATARAAADRSLRAASGRSVEFRIAAGLFVSGDAWLLSVALQKLLDNAVKFTALRRRAVIQIGEEELDGRRVFFVKDNGAGFDRRYASTLFVAFQRLHKPSQFPGAGIGLATVQRAIHRHQGKVWADAVPGRGATFYFTLDACRDTGTETGSIDLLNR